MIDPWAQGLWSIVVVQYTGQAISVIASLLSLAALLHCALQRPSAVSAVSPLSKGAWLAILAGSVLLSSLGVAQSGGGLGIFGLIGLVAGLVYLLDVRRAIRDIGSGSW